MGKGSPEPRANPDSALWRRAMQDVTPLRREAALRRPKPVRPSKLGSEAPGAPHPPPPPRPLPPAAANPPPLDRLDGIDRANAERLKRGLRAVEARLDLHGMTQAEAHRALSAFVESCRLAGRRCVLVITGRGAFGGGVLRQAVPRWLQAAELRRHVLAIAPAQPRHGGGGALYVLLKRLREPR